MTKINIGVPQGNALGSLFFLVYINNLLTVSSILHSVLFADDTCLTLANENCSDPINTFNSDLNILFAWLTKNKLSLVFEKNGLH